MTKTFPRLTSICSKLIYDVWSLRCIKMNSFIEALFFLLCGMCSQSILQRGYNKFHKGTVNDIGVEKAKLRQDMSCEATGTKGGCGGGVSCVSFNSLFSVALPWGRGGPRPSGGSGAQPLGSAECNDCMQTPGGHGLVTSYHLLSVAVSTLRHSESCCWPCR